MKPQKKIALFGGAFNPPTISHAAIIRALAETGSFDEVWVMPSNSRTDKTIIVAAEQRIELLEVMLADLQALDVDVKIIDIELKMKRKTETHRTIQMLKKSFPLYHFTYVIGEDSLATLPEWHNGAWLLRYVDWIVIPRRAHQPIKVLPQHIHYLPVQMHELSSTQVRNAVAAGRSIRTFVTPSVEEIIKRKELYHVA